MYHFRLLVFTCLLVLLLPHHLFLGWICCSSKVDPCDGINCDNNHGTRFNDVYSSVLPQTQQDLSTITVDNSPKAIPVNVYLLSARDAYKYGVKEIALSVTIMAQQPETALVRADSKVNNEMDSMAEFSIVATVKQHDTLKNILLVFDRFISNVNKRMMRKTNAMLPLSYRCSRYDVNAFTFSVLVGEQVFQYVKITPQSTLNGTTISTPFDVTIQTNVTSTKSVIISSANSLQDPRRISSWLLLCFLLFVGYFISQQINTNQILK